uniref:Uncharacterized protein n=1 Tax=Junco hyemalis TaxID=40217 RepID=A0A8C5NL88_JUNHY
MLGFVISCNSALTPALVFGSRFEMKNVVLISGSLQAQMVESLFESQPWGRVVENISKRCGGFLRKLSLRGCQGVGDNALRYSRGWESSISTFNKRGEFAPTLALRQLLAWSRISPEAFPVCPCVPSEGCPLLEQLIISWCDQVTKDGIQALVRGCGGLRALSLKGCTQLEDEALKFIGAHCPELVTLNLQTCLVSGTAQDSLMECSHAPAHGALGTSSSLLALQGH